jgi:hypothetical protein
MAKSVSLRSYLVIVATVFVAMMVVTLVVFLAVQRAAHHLPGARPDLKAGDVAAPEAPPASRDSGGGS